MLINLTPHAIVIQRESGVVLALEPSGQVARVKTVQEILGNVEGVPVVRTLLLGIEGLPDPQDGVTYVASSLVAQAAAALGRGDVVAPDTGATAIREGGQIVAVRRLQKF